MSTLPAFMQNYQGRGLADQLAASVGSGSPPTLSIEGGAFSITDAAGETERVGAHDPKIGLYVDVVIADVNEHKSKIFYGLGPDGKLKKYDPTNVSPPICFSDNGVAPSVQSGSPQSATCASCPHNELGSAIGFKGTGIRACKDQIKMAVVLPQYPDEMFMLRVPPNSFKHLRALTEWCKKANVPLETVVTRIYFEQGIVGTLVFIAVSHVTDENLWNYMQKAIADKTTDALVGRNDVPRTMTQQGVAPAGIPTQHTQPVAQIPYQPSPPLQPTFQPGSMQPSPAQPAATPMQQPTAAPSAGQAPAAEQSRRRRRTREQIAADNAAAGVGQPVTASGQPVAPMQAPFQQPAASQAGPAQQAAAGPGNGANFGIQPGTPPNAELMNTLNSIFPQK